MSSCANPHDLASIDPGILHCLADGLYARLPDFAHVVLHPARVGGIGVGLCRSNTNLTSFGGKYGRLGDGQAAVDA